ncbi:hypothetical protein J4233_04475 [Candidatus Pacearchaeota archaeon]|nr:hypothetical protein [Candidatus Pacearchaeota archaeon]
MTKNSQFVYIFLVLTVLSLNLANAQALVAGKVYNADFSDILSGVNVKVVCNNAEPSNTITLGDGTYAVRFEETECNESDSVSVVASKSGFQDKSGSGTISRCEGTDCEEPYVTIINLGMKTQTSNGGNTGGGSSGRHYLCGNGKCDSGESVNTCPKDCKTIELLTQTTNTTANADDEETTGTQATRTEIPEETLSETTNASSFPGITGAVIGTLGAAGTFLIIVFLIGIIAAAITVRIIRKRNRFQEF